MCFFSPKLYLPRWHFEFHELRLSAQNLPRCVNLYEANPQNLTLKKKKKKEQERIEQYNCSSHRLKFFCCFLENYSKSFHCDESKKNKKSKRPRNSEHLSGNKLDSIRSQIVNVANVCRWKWWFKPKRPSLIVSFFVNQSSALKLLSLFQEHRLQQMITCSLYTNAQTKNSHFHSCPTRVFWEDLEVLEPKLFFFCCWLSLFYYFFRAAKD